MQRAQGWLQALRRKVSGSLQGLCCRRVRGTPKTGRTLRAYEKGDRTHTFWCYPAENLGNRHASSTGAATIRLSVKSTVGLQ